MEKQRSWEDLARFLSVRPFRREDAEIPRDIAIDAGLIPAKNPRDGVRQVRPDKLSIDDQAVVRIARAIAPLGRDGYQRLDRNSSEYKGIRDTIAPHGCCAAVFGAIAYGLVEYQTGRTGSQWSDFQEAYSTIRSPTLDAVETAALGVTLQRMNDSKRQRLSYLLPRIREYLSRHEGCQVDIPSLWLRVALYDSDAPDRKTVAFAMKMVRYASHSCSGAWPDLRDWAVVAVDNRILRQSLDMRLIITRRGLAEASLDAGDPNVRRVLVDAWNRVVQALPRGPDAFELDTLLWEINSVPPPHRAAWLDAQWGLGAAVAEQVEAGLYPQT